MVASVRPARARRRRTLGGRLTDRSYVPDVRTWGDPGDEADEHAVEHARHDKERGRVSTIRGDATFGRALLSLLLVRALLDLADTTRARP